MAITSVTVSQPDIHSAAFGFEGVLCIGRSEQARRAGQAGMAFLVPSCNLQMQRLLRAAAAAWAAAR
jgi:hypothetical protein